MGTGPKYGSFCILCECLSETLVHREPQQHQVNRRTCACRLPPSETQGCCSRTLSSAAMCAPYLSIASQLQCPLFSVYFMKTNVGTFHMSPLPDGTILPSASRRVGGGLQEEAVLLLGSGHWLTRFPLSSGFSSSGPECRGVSSTSKPAAARHSGAFVAQ